MQHIWGNLWCQGISYDTDVFLIGFWQLHYLGWEYCVTFKYDGDRGGVPQSCLWKILTLRKKRWLMPHLGFETFLAHETADKFIPQMETESETKLTYACHCPHSADGFTRIPPNESRRSKLQRSKSWHDMLYFPSSCDPDVSLIVTIRCNFSMFVCDCKGWQISFVVVVVVNVVKYYLKPRIHTTQLIQFEQILKH